MNEAQRLWWEQTRSDHWVLTLFRKNGAAACHQLHYLQMVTEKLGKAYFWRAKKPPKKGHAFFVKFLQALLDRSRAEVEMVASLLGFPRASDLETWVRTVAPLAYGLQQLSPDLAGENAPNAEYPWPHRAPAEYPAGFSFPVWEELTATARGRRLLKVIDDAVREFPKYA